MLKSYKLGTMPKFKIIIICYWGYALLSRNYLARMAKPIEKEAISSSPSCNCYRDFSW